MVVITKFELKSFIATTTEAVTSCSLLIDSGAKAVFSITELVVFYLLK